MSQEAYAYYLKTVLGVKSYIQPEAQVEAQSESENPVLVNSEPEVPELKTIEPIIAEVSSPKEEVKIFPREKVIAVVGSNLSNQEIILLEKIAVAAKFSNFYLKVASEHLASYDLTGKTIINFDQSTHKSTSLYEVENLESEGFRLEVLPLSQMLPPTHEDKIALNKSRLWASLKKLNF